MVYCENHHNTWMSCIVALLSLTRHLYRSRRIGVLLYTGSLLQVPNNSIAFVMPATTRRSTMCLPTESPPSKKHTIKAEYGPNHVTDQPVTPSPVKSTNPSRKTPTIQNDTDPPSKKRRNSKALPIGAANQPVTPSPVKPKSSTARKTPARKKDTKPACKPPKEWQDTYALVVELRKDRTAPCDHSGCEALPDANETPETRRFQVLLSLMLSSQTKDAVVGAAIRSMQADKVLTVQSIHEMDASALNTYIKSVGFHNNKTKYIKAAVEILIEKYGGDIPTTAAEMIVDLPGVGPKMAYICEAVAWKTVSGIGVDTHMHRIFNLLNWVKTKTPEQTRVALESWLPVSYWLDVNLLWVGFGQEVQQEKTKILRKALACSQPKKALALLKQCGFDYYKVGATLDLLDEINRVSRSDK